MTTTSLTRKPKAWTGLSLHLLQRHLDDPSGKAGTVARILRHHGGSLPAVVLLAYLEREHLGKRTPHDFLLDALADEPKRFKWYAL